MAGPEGVSTGRRRHLSPRAAPQAAALDDHGPAGAYYRALIKVFPRALALLILVAVLVAPIEALMSFSSMEAHCTGNGGFRAAHLTLAAVVLVVGIATRRDLADGRVRQ